MDNIQEICGYIRHEINNRIFREGDTVTEMYLARGIEQTIVLLDRFIGKIVIDAFDIRADERSIDVELNIQRPNRNHKNYGKPARELCRVKTQFLSVNKNYPTIASDSEKLYRKMPKIPFYGHHSPAVECILNTCFDECIATEKVNGLRLYVWYSQGQWHYSVDESYLYLRYFKNSAYELQKLMYSVFQYEDLNTFMSKYDADKNKTYVFSVVTPKINKQVDVEKAVFICTIDNNNGYYDTYNYAGFTYFASHYVFNTIGDAEKYCYTHPIDGLVIYDDKKPIVKIENLQYQMLAGVRGQKLNTQVVFTIISSLQQSEYLTFFPQDRLFFICCEMFIAEFTEYLTRLFINTKNLWDNELEILFRNPDEIQEHTISGVYYPLDTLMVENTGFRNQVKALIFKYRKSNGIQSIRDLILISANDKNTVNLYESIIER